VDLRPWRTRSIETELDALSVVSAIGARIAHQDSEVLWHGARVPIGGSVAAGALRLWRRNGVIVRVPGATFPGLVWHGRVEPLGEGSHLVVRHRPSVPMIVVAVLLVLLISTGVPSASQWLVGGTLLSAFWLGALLAVSGDDHPEWEFLQSQLAAAVDAERERKRTG